MTLFPNPDPLQGNVAGRSSGSDARSVWPKALLAGGILFVLWRIARGFRSLFWSAFGMAMAVHYSGMLDWWS